MNLSEDKKKPLRNLPIDQKRSMLLMKLKGSNQETGHKFDTPDEYRSYLEINSKSYYNSGKLLACLKSCRIALTNNPLSWVVEFGADGMRIILDVLSDSSKEYGILGIKKF